MKIAVLALQGAFIEHEKVLSELGAECVELRNAEDLQQDFDALVLPGVNARIYATLTRWFFLGGRAPCRGSSLGKAACLSH